MRVLVTGHLGYIGTCLVPRLLSAGYAVTGSDSDLFSHCNYGTGPVPITNLQQDVRDLQRHQLEGFDAIVHLAGLSNDPLGELNPQLTDEINFRATERLARLARDVGIRRFVFSSSCSTYGKAGEDFVNEDHGFNPVTAYGRSKVDAETALSRLATKDFSPTFLRNATVYGYTPRIRFDLVINNLVAWAYTTGRVLLKSQGLAWRPLVHVEDVADAFIATLRAPVESIHDQAFNIGITQENFRVKALAEMIVTEIPGTRLDMAKGAQADERTYRVNCDKARSVLKDWKPRWETRHGIRNLNQIYNQYGLQQQDFEGSRYQRVAHLQKLMASGAIQQDLRKPVAEKAE